MVIDYTQPLGQVRLIITDTSEVVADQLLTDAQLNAFLSMYDQNVNRAAAKALRTIAASEVLVSKKIRTEGGVSTDGPAVAASLRALADDCIAEAEGVEMDDAAHFEFIPYGGTTSAEGEEVKL